MSARATNTHRSAMDELRATVSGGAAAPSDGAFAQACQLWNGAVQHRPAMIAFCRCAEDVTAAVRFARRHRLALSVRGGGHDWAGRAVRPDGMVVDLAGMREVVVDERARVATVAGGALIKDLVDAAANHGLVAASGSCNGVGMAGLTLGGGYGLLNGSYGLAADNLLSAEVVLADGRRVMAGPDEAPDLFWAIRGGGGNYGVVTAMRIRLHQPQDVLGGAIVFPWDEASPVLRRLADIAPQMPDELGMNLAMMHGPDGRPALMLAPLWNGKRADGKRSDGERAMAELQGLGAPQMVNVGPTSYADMIAQFDPFMEPGRHWALRTRWLPELDADAVAVMLAAVSAMTSPASLVGLHHFHGAAARVPSDATAFGLRRPHYLVEIIASWEPADDGSAHRRWADELCRDLGPFALPGGYANLLGPEHREQVADAYGGNGDKLLAVKRRFDPNGVFSSAIPLPHN